MRLICGQRIIEALWYLRDATGDAAASMLRPYRREGASPVTIELFRYRFPPGVPTERRCAWRPGKRYALQFRAIEGSDGLTTITQLGIPAVRLIEPGSDFVVTVSPGAGLRGACFNFACTHYCGVGHGGMYGAIEIV
jgi:hypothetical protein